MPDVVVAVGHRDAGRLFISPARVKCTAQFSTSESKNSTPPVAKWKASRPTAMPCSCSKAATLRPSLCNPGENVRPRDGGLQQIWVKCPSGIPASGRAYKSLGNVRVRSVQTYNGHRVQVALLPPNAFHADRRR